MKKKSKTKQDILFETKTKPILNDYSAQAQDNIEREKIKGAIRRIADAAEQRIKKLNAELNFVKEELRQETEKRKQAVEILREQEPLLSERVKEISCLYSVINFLGNKKYASDEEKIRDILRIIPRVGSIRRILVCKLFLKVRSIKPTISERRHGGRPPKSRLAASPRVFWQ